MSTFYVGIKDVDTADRANVEELIQRATETPSYDIDSDVYRVVTSLTPEEFYALPWPDGCTFRFAG